MFLRAILFILLFSGVAVQAQVTDELNFQFKQYSVTNGLADNTVIKSVKDKYGFLWIVTLNGISRFDGSSFKNYMAQTVDNSGLRSGWISDIIIDDQQQLWVSTEGGLCYYNEAADKFIYINKPHELQLIFKMPLANGSNNFIWVVAEDGLRKINTVDKTYTATSLKRVVDPQFASMTSTGKLLIGTRGHGLLEYDIDRDAYEKIELPGLPADVHLMGALPEKDGTWIACSEGLLWLDNKREFYLYNKDLNAKKVQALMCAAKFPNALGEHYIICGSYDEKLYLFDQQKKVFTFQWKASYSNPAGFNAAIINNLYAENNFLWISGNRGLQQVNIFAQQQQSFFVEGLHEAGQAVFVKKAIQHYSQEKKEVWLIPWQPAGGIIQYDMQAKKIINHFNSNTTNTSILYKDIIHGKKYNEVIAAGPGQVDFFNSSSGLLSSVKINGTANCIKEDNNGNCWIGLDDGIVLIEHATKKVQKFTHDFTGTDVENNLIGGRFPIYDIVQVNDSTLYLSNIKYGLFSFNTRTTKFTAYRVKSNTSFSTSNRSTTLAYRGGDTIYTGTFNGMAIFKIGLQNFAANITAPMPGPLYVYSSVIDSNGIVWARTNKGLIGYDPLNHKIFSYKITGEPDINNFQQELSLFNKNIIMGHDGGFSIFNTSAILQQDLPAPSLYFNSILLNNKLLHFKRDIHVKINFNHRQNQLSFQVAAIEYNNADGIEFFYKLEGLDKDWNTGGNKNNFSYDFLPHGEYRFCIYARNNINKTQSETLYFPFVIEPAWWQHWWLWPLLAVLFAALVLYFALKRVRHIRMKEAQQTQQNKMLAELELKMLRSQMNPHFIFNSLNSIQKYIWQNKEEDAAEYLARFAKLMRAILDHSREEVITLREEMNVMKLYIELEHRRSNGSFVYHLEVDASLDQDKIMIPPMIMQPFIENAIWHGLNKKEGRGHLTVTVNQYERQLVCTIKDDGNGFDLKKANDKQEQTSLGIEITKQRLEKLMHNTGLRAEVNISSHTVNDINQKTGTVITIYLPLQII